MKKAFNTSFYEELLTQNFPIKNESDYICSSKFKLNVNIIL